MTAGILHNRKDFLPFSFPLGKLDAVWFRPAAFLFGAKGICIQSWEFSLAYV
jgi:hypothetical protein